MSTVIASGLDASGLESPGSRFIARIWMNDAVYLWCVYHKDVAAVKNIFYAVSDDDGVTWTETQLTSDATYHQQFPAIAVDSAGNIHLVWFGSTSLYSTATQIWYKKYSATTLSWESTTNISNYSDGHNEYPSISIDKDDHVHVAFSGARPTIYQILHTEYTTSWATPTQITSEAEDQRYPHVVAGLTNMPRIVFQGGITNAIQNIRMVRYNGQSWESIENITASDTVNFQYACLAIDMSNNSHIAYQAEDLLTVYQIEYATDTSGTWATTALTSDSTYEQTRPSISIDSDDNITVMWTGYSVASPTVKQLQITSYSTAWTGLSELTTDALDQLSPVLLWSLHPYFVIAGEYLNSGRPDAGHAYIYLDGTDLTYAESSSIAWDDLEDMPNEINITITLTQPNIRIGFSSAS